MKSFLTAASTVLLSLSSVSALSDHVKQNVRANLDGHRVVSINYNTLTNSVVDFLDSHQADHFGSDGDDVHFKLHPDAVKALEDQQISFDDFTDNWVDKMEARFNEPNFFCGDSTHDCAKRDLQAFYSSYQTLAALHARLTDVAAASAGLATIGSIGTSYQGRDLKTIHIGDQTKPLVFYFCNIHAREWLTPMFCMYMAENLVANGGHALLEKFSFTILISANPDGYEYSWSTNNNWRKTRKPNSGSSCVGTDGNRNYPISRCGSGASTSPCSDTYCGAAALDQPETAAIAAYAAANADRLIATNDVHAYGQLWMCPWAYTTAVPPAADFQKMQQCNAAAAAGIEAIHGRQFDYGPVATTIYLAAGGSVDYFYASLGVIYAYTVEVRGTDFHPAASNILPSNEEIFGGMVASLECVADVEGISGTPTVPVPTDPPVATSSPTKFPTTGCADLVPSGLVYSGSGLPAECTDFGSFYCNNYAIVRERCPRTCGLCDAILTGLTMSVEAASDKLSKVSIMSPAALVTVYIAAPVGAAVFAAVIAVVLIKRRRAAAATEAAPTDVVV